MVKSTLAAALAVSAVLLGTSAFAQSPYPAANQSVYTPMSAAHAQAQANKAPGQCAKEVSKMQDQIGLRLQQFATGAETRGSVMSELDTASNAAKAGDEDTCWHWYDRAQQTVR
jgi:hypothetical protein